MGALLPPPRDRFAARVRSIDAPTAARMHGRSWRDHPRCPPHAALALVEASHLTLEGGAATGELVVAQAIAGRVVTLLARSPTDRHLAPRVSPDGRTLAVLVEQRFFEYVLLAP